MIDLLSVRDEEYGPEYKGHLLEQYKLFVSSAEKISDRRQNANSHFLTLNAGLISLLGISSAIQVLGTSPWIKIGLCLTGALISIVYFLLINSYKQINGVKFKIIHQVEKNLPLQLYHYEWERLGRGKNWIKYFPFSHVELVLPVILGLMYWTIASIIFFKTFH